MMKALSIQPPFALWPPIVGVAAAALVGAFSGPVGLALLAGGGAAFVWWRFPETTLAMFLIIGVFKANPALNWLPESFDLTIYFAALIWIFIAYRVHKGGQKLPMNNAFILPALLLILLMFVTLINSANFSYALDKTGRFVILTLLAYLAPVFILKDDDSLQRLAKTLVIVGFFLAINMIRAWLINPDSSVLTMGTQYLALGRVIGVGVIFAGYLVVSSKAPLWKAASLLLIPVGTWALLASGGRGPALALILSPVVVACIAAKLQGFKRTAKFLLPGAGVLIVVAVLYALHRLPTKFQERMALALDIFSGGSGGSSLSVRFALFSSAWQMLKQSPFLGAGIGAFGTAASVAAPYPHNVFLELGAELGLLGVAFFVIIVLAAAQKLTSIFSRTTGTSVKTAAATGLVLLVYALLNALISSDINDKILWFAMSLPYALAGWPTTWERET